MVFGKKIASSITVFGLFWICVFGQWHTVNALGADTNTIPFELVWSDEDYYNQYVAGYYNNLSWSDWKSYAVDSVASSFPMNTTKQVTDTGGNVIELFNLVHNALFTGIEAGQDWVDLLFVDRNDGKLKSDGNIMTPDLIAILDQYFKTSGSVDSSFQLGGYTFYLVPSGGSISGTWFNTIRNNSSYDEYFCFPSGISSSPVWVGSFYSGCTIAYSGSGANLNSFYNGSVSSGYCVGLNMTGTLRDSISAVFFGNNLPSSEPEWNGDGYYRDETVIDVNLPAIPSIDWKGLSNKYYIEYGDEFVEGDVNNFYYDIAYNYYPATYTYDVPYWLLNRQSDDIVLETVVYEYSLPSLELEEGDASFWQGLFEALPVTVSVVLLGVILCWLIFTLI